MKRSSLKLPVGDWEFGGSACLCVHLCLAFKLIQTYGCAFRVKVIISESRTLFSWFTDL